MELSLIIDGKKNECNKESSLIINSKHFRLNESKLNDSEKLKRQLENVFIRYNLINTTITFGYTFDDFIQNKITVRITSVNHP